jgi:putative membrane protein
VWLVEIATAVLYWRATRGRALTTSERWGGWAGVAMLCLALDWPMGPLAAGYLASAHALQFLLVAFVAPPLLLRGMRPWLIERLERAPRARAAASALTAPLLAAVVFNIVVITTHVPRVNDALMPMQLGAFAVDAAWFVSGVWFWWPMVIPVPERPRFVAPLRMLYLFLGTLVHTGIAMWMLVQHRPMYGLYELAPRVTGMSPLTDLKVAGGVMELVGAGIVFGIITVMFFRWSGGTGAERPDHWRSGADERHL